MCGSRLGCADKTKEAANNQTRGSKDHIWAEEWGQRRTFFRGLRVNQGGPPLHTQMWSLSTQQQKTDSTAHSRPLLWKSNLWIWWQMRRKGKQVEGTWPEVFLCSSSLSWVGRTGRWCVLWNTLLRVCVGITLTSPPQLFVFDGSGSLKKQVTVWCKSFETDTNVG